MPLQALAQILREQHEAMMIRQAETIRNWRPGMERIEQAEIHVRSVLWEQSIGRVGQATRYRVYSILNFVMPDDAAPAHDQTPLETLERDATWERAYYQQIERRSCPECGDGICPSS